ncbi:MAG: hypothetical protein ACR2M4_01570 [Actinomycetota bacterium]
MVEGDEGLAGDAELYHSFFGAWLDGTGTIVEQLAALVGPGAALEVVHQR